MKKRELEEALRKLGWSFLRHGAKHDIWAKGEQQEPIPRHAEINENWHAPFSAALPQESDNALSR